MTSTEIMEKEKSSGQSSPGKPFLLRPSALASPGTFGSAFLQTNNSLLRPSKLSEIAEKIENSSADIKKRKAENCAADAPVKQENSLLKKKKVEKVSDEQSQHRLKLNEDIAKPKGIGSFGFCRDDDSESVDKGLNSANETSENSASQSFIFGQHINTRVSGFKDITGGKEVVDDNGQPKLDEEELEKHLVENANEHMKKEESTKLHLREVEVITGEEGERNVLQVQCKLHLFNNEKKNWTEKGRGTLKLNDICQSEKQGVFQSRIVFRTQGSHMVVLNTFLWPEMCYEKASIKSLRITALNPDTKKVNVYLISAPSKDILQIHTAIDRRIMALKRNKEETEHVVNKADGFEDENKHNSEGSSIPEEVPSPAEDERNEVENTESTTLVETTTRGNSDTDNSNSTAGIGT